MQNCFNVRYGVASTNTYNAPRHILSPTGMVPVVQQSVSTRVDHDVAHTQITMEEPRHVVSSSNR